jgi:thioredoxin
MDFSSFKQQISNKPLPTIVEFWAPWCGPCKMMAPGLEKVSKEFEAKVELWKINADENPDILRSLGVMSIPTVLGYSGGEELFRVTGALNPSQISQLFLNAQEGKKLKSELAPAARQFRLLIGFAMMIMGWLGDSYIILPVGALIAFSAVADRCPIFQSLKSRLLNFLAKKQVQGHPETGDLPGSEPR